MIAVKAVGFDLGDTLLFYRGIPLSWESLYAQALSSVAKACGTAPTAEQLLAAEAILRRYNTRLFPRALEVRADDIFYEVLSAWHLNTVTNIATAVKAFFAFFQGEICRYDDVNPVLAMLRVRGYPIGVLTDVPYGMPREFVEADVRSADLIGRIDVLLTSADVGRRKPKPDGYIALAAQLGVRASEMIYVGNEPKDIVGAKAAGSLAVLLNRGSAAQEHGQDFTISSMAELPILLDAEVR